MKKYGYDKFTIIVLVIALCLSSVIYAVYSVLSDHSTLAFIFMAITYLAVYFGAFIILKEYNKLKDIESEIKRKKRLIDNSDNIKIQ